MTTIPITVEWGARMAENNTRYKVRFSGDVQGVGFRMTAVSEARGLAANGFVKNEPDGSVTLDVDGPESDLKELVHQIESELSDHISDTEIEQLESLNRQGGVSIKH